MIRVCVSKHTYTMCLSRLEDERMELVQKMLKQRETERQSLNETRLELLWLDPLSLSVTHYSSKHTHIILTYV